MPAHQGNVGGRAAHVVGDQSVDARAARRVRGGDDAGGVPGHDRPGRLVGDQTGGDRAAVSVHDEEVARVPLALERRAQASEITFEDGPYRGVHRRRHAALVLACLADQRMTGRDVAVRPELQRDPFGQELVLGVAVGVQEMDDERLAARVQQRADRAAQPFLVERAAHAARRVDPLVHLVPEATGHERDEAAEQSVRGRARAAAELEHVPEAARRDQTGVQDG